MITQLISLSPNPSKKRQNPIDFKIKYEQENPQNLQENAMDLESPPQKNRQNNVSKSS